MASTRGRAVVITLTNKSGGSVAAGDVVVVDTGNNEAFTTSTAGAVTGGVGIAQETIANNATGRVLIHGYAALVNVSASVTRGNYGKTHTVVKQAVDAGSSRVAGVFCQFLTGGTTPTARVFAPDLGAAAGNVTADAIWDAAGDLAVGSGSDTAARLAKGSAGAVLAMLNGAVTWNAGTSFPGSPATGDRYFRTDRGIEYFYDGTRWLSVATFNIPLGPMADVSLVNAGTSGQNVGRSPIPALYDVWLVSMEWQSIVRTTNSGTAFWTYALVKYTPAGAATTIVSGNTSAQTAGQFVGHSTAIGALIQSSAHAMMQVEATKTSTPGNHDFSGFVVARWVG